MEQFNDSKPRKEFDLAAYKKKIGIDKYEEESRQRNIEKEKEREKELKAETFKMKMIENYVLDLTKIYNMD